MLRIAVLDDYQYAAATYADWSRLPEPVEVVEFADHLADADAVVRRLAPFDVVVAMRERTPFPRAVLERLPNLKLLVTTGGHNASIGVAAGAARRGPGFGHRAAPPRTTAPPRALGLPAPRHEGPEDAAGPPGGRRRTAG